MNSNSPTKTGLVVRRKSLVLTGAAVLMLVGLWGLWHYMTHPPRPWMARWQVSRYLKKHSILSNFKTDFPFPSRAEMSHAPASKASETGPQKGKLTGKDFDTLASEYISLKTSVLGLEQAIPEGEAEIKILKPRLEQLSKDLAEAKGTGSTNLAVMEARVDAVQQRLKALDKTTASRPDLEAKQKALEPIVSDLWDFQRLWAAEMQIAEGSGSNVLVKAREALSAAARDKLADAKSYELIYKLIGQHLWVAERLLGSANPEHRRVGLSLAMEASRWAIDDAQNGWLAGRIVEGYVWPHLDVATDSSRRSFFNLENLLDQCANIFRNNDESQTMVRNYQILLARAKTPQKADQARSQIAMAYEQGGNLKEAISTLRQIKATNDFRWAISRIPRMERQLKTGR